MPIGRAVLAGHPRTAAGLRDKAVLIEQQTKSVGSTRFPKESWTPLRTVLASKLDLRADERYVSSQDSPFKETQWQIPYTADMDPDAIDVPTTRRLKYLGRVYNIRTAAIVTDGTHRIGIECITLGN